LALIHFLRGLWEVGKVLGEDDRCEPGRTLLVEIHEGHAAGAVDVNHLAGDEGDLADQRPGVLPHHLGTTLFGTDLGERRGASNSEK
jgi:hypothetical protein